MMAFRFLALLATGTFVVAQSLDPALGDCAITCYNNVKAQSGSWSTPCPADEMTCICKAAEFKNGVHDCAAQCPGGVDFAGRVLADLNKICDVAIPPAHVVETTMVSSAQAPGATTPPPEVMVSAPTTSASTSQAPTSQSPEPTPTAEVLSVPSPTGITSSSATSEEAKPAEPTATTTSTSNAEGTTSSSPEATHSSEPAGLTTAAMAGIGIGATAAVIAIAAIAFWLVFRRRNNRPDGFSSRNMVRISDPAPGGGQSFAGDQHYETGLSELEMKSRRYEDMVPRQQPRHMV